MGDARRIGISAPLLATSLVTLTRDSLAEIMRKGPVVVGIVQKGLGLGSCLLTAIGEELPLILVEKLVATLLSFVIIFYAVPKLFMWVDKLYLLDRKKKKVCKPESKR